MTPPAPRRKLSEGDVEALFAGTLQAPAGTFAGAHRHRLPDLPVRYCHACGEVRNDLLSFRGDRDWYPTVPLDAPVRALVKVLRARHSVRWVVLCTDCMHRPSPHLERESDSAA